MASQRLRLNLVTRGFWMTVKEREQVGRCLFPRKREEAATLLALPWALWGLCPVPRTYERGMNPASY